MRARLAIAVSGAEVELREVVLRDKPAELLAASPKGTVPVLVLPDGEVIEQSLDIMLWALGRRDPERWLTPPQGSLADMLALVAGNDGGFKHSLDRYKYPMRYTQECSGQVSAFAATHRTAGAEWLTGLDERLHSDWVLGNQACLADMALLPFLRQFAHTDAAWFASQPWPRLQAWLARFEASERYLTVMGKHDPWQGVASSSPRL